LSFLTFSYAALLLGSVLGFRLAPQRWRPLVAIGASAIFYASWNVSLCMLMFAAAVFAWQGSRDLRGLPPRHRWAGAVVLVVMALAGLSLSRDDVLGLQTWRAALGSVTVLWLASLALPKSGWSRRSRLAAYLIGLLGLLACFKYANFFIDSVSALAGARQTGSVTPLISVLLPVGISFYVFQKISFLVDVWRNPQSDAPELADFCAYATFFPQLVAGPIERVGTLLPQLRAPLPWSFPLAVEAGGLLLTGYFKKVFVADNCAVVANFAFDHPDAIGWPWLLLGTLAFAIQIYGDFSGYTDIARGSALLLGVRLSSNFALPYLATSVIDFWHRWHMTLSSWLRDYLYKSLGGSHRGRLVKYRNLMLVMVLGGLWHGASWNFVVWGGYWGLLLSLNHAWRDRFGASPRAGWLAQAGTVLGWAATICVVLLGWALFRATDLGGLLKFLSTDGASPTAEWRGAAQWLLLHALPLLLLQALAWRRRDEAAALMARPLVGGLLLTFGLWLTLGSDATQTAFIYFQF
jgi:alginate O-acetyltransferase complex protein AlgI